MSCRSLNAFGVVAITAAIGAGLIYLFPASGFATVGAIFLFGAYVLLGLVVQGLASGRVGPRDEAIPLRAWIILLPWVIAPFLSVLLLRVDGEIMPKMIYQYASSDIALISFAVCAASLAYWLTKNHLVRADVRIGVIVWLPLLPLLIGDHGITVTNPYGRDAYWFIITFSLYVGGFVGALMRIRRSRVIDD